LFRGKGKDWGIRDKRPRTKEKKNVGRLTSVNSAQIPPGEKLKEAACRGEFGQGKGNSQILGKADEGKLWGKRGVQEGKRSRADKGSDGGLPFKTRQRAREPQPWVK